jgi:RNA polymerase sigma-70 factor, ECF subfamily
MDPTDEDLVRRVRAGELDSFTTLVHRYYPRCLRFGLRMLGERADAEEAVQDAFLRAYRSLDRYEERDRFGSWMFQILANQCRTLGAKRRRRERTFVPYDVVADFSDQPADGFLAAELQRALMQLAPDHREALLLKFVEDHSYEDMAEMTGVGVSALKMRVKRAREQLRTLTRGWYDA